MHAADLTFNSDMSSAVVYAAAALGTYFLLRNVGELVYSLANAYLIPGKPLTTYGAGNSKAWAIVTGASDGIGKEFALQLAKAKFNVLILARTKSKLDAVAAEAKASNPSANVIVHPFDFSTTKDSDYEALKKAIDGITSDGGFVGVLVNNVGINHDIPTPFLEESEQVVQNIVQVNILAQLKLTQIVAPKMIAYKAAKKQSSLILNIGSVAGTIPSGLLSVYAASKAFLRFWSQALGMELGPKGIHVEHVTTYFVTTAMSKIRRANFSTPTPKVYVKSVLKNVGKSLDSTPFPAHALMMWTINTFTTESFRLWYSNQMHVSIRKRALKKREREAKAQ
ncbi:hypothetical protein HDU97_002523 [Phlyctochytrium planicorne]|nr:hypothetical protein HDU97_002523 [Phlyctochytrium planicorne]